ncbi:Uncharacterized conserved protein, DUF952 family [Parafrankia irregularis]|uniref:Uncharacterized conserved protein, DUF952 family n=1 Tax=Parafrankia irregularis TaxID=795642 RepID=A0A0S4QSS9_9ACTN|nr:MULTISPECIES: DUF952 domain-containing protein [Parafrankia]MBE3205116.1 DUF952 domain-containing protein [Parafrankia sp. CH37]CUU58657.1 Uncharacterized conserved protein, DUF952 family [Parafrankia irregularis]
MICHLVSRSEWAAGADGYRPASLGDEGFVHFSAPELVLETANLYYRGRTDMLLVVVDPQGLTAPLRWEPAAGPADRGGALFPHLYGPIDAAAVRVVVPLPCAPDGSFTAMPTF